MKQCSFPLFLNYLIADAKSDHKELSEAAFTVLENIEHTMVRQFAFELIKEGRQINNAICLLAKNYQKEDKKLFIKLVQNVPVNNRSSDWH